VDIVNNRLRIERALARTVKEASHDDTRDYRSRIFARNG